MRVCNCPTCDRFLCASDGNVRVKCRYCKSWWLFDVNKVDVERVSSIESKQFRPAMAR